MGTADACGSRVAWHAPVLGEGHGGDGPRVTCKFGHVLCRKGQHTAQQLDMGCITAQHGPWEPASTCACIHSCLFARSQSMALQHTFCWRTSHTRTMVSWQPVPRMAPSGWNAAVVMPQSISGSDT